MRLQAAISLLHLSTVEIFANAIAPKFVRLACVIQVRSVLYVPILCQHNYFQDPCFNVRLAFLNKVILLLQPRKLPGRYNVIPFLTVLDPEAEPRNIVSNSLLINGRSLTRYYRLHLTSKTRNGSFHQVHFCASSKYDG